MCKEYGERVPIRKNATNISRLNHGSYNSEEVTGLQHSFWKSISSYQADMCVTFDGDTDLETIFKDVDNKTDEDVVAIGIEGPGASYENFQFEIKQGEYICFEITEAPGKIFEKLF